MTPEKDNVIAISGGEGAIPYQGFSRGKPGISLLRRERSEAIESLPSGSNRFMMRLFKTAIIRGLITKDEE